nr:hypothetical protein [Baekduia alba]
MPSQPAEVRGRVHGRDGRHRQVELPPDRLGDRPRRDALLGDRVQHRPGRSRLERQPEEARGVGPVDRRPAAGAATDEARDALVARGADERRDEAVVTAPEQQDLPAIIRESLDALRAVAAG